MNDFVVLYRLDNLSILDEPLCFICSAENMDHAEEQCENAYPRCEIVWVVEGNNTEVALKPRVRLEHV